MKEIRQRRRFEKIIFSRFTFLLFLALVISLVSPIIKVYKKSKEATMKSDLVQEEINKLNTRKDNLEANINRLNTPMGVEEELRSKFQIKKPDEEFIVIIEDDVGIPINTQNKKEDIGFWGTTKNFIRSIF